MAISLWGVHCVNSAYGATVALDPPHGADLITVFTCHDVKISRGNLCFAVLEHLRYMYTYVLIQRVYIYT